MSDAYEKLPLPTVSFWMDGSNAQALCRAAQIWFQKLGDAAIWPVRQCDPMTSSMPILDLLAWQRGVTRFNGEPESLYRLRVKYAYANARDAGQTLGWQRIMVRLGLLGPDELTLEERIPGQDWDIVGIYLSDQRLVDLQDFLFEVMIPEYRRTCRRYTPVARAVKSVILGLGVFDNDHTTFEAALPIRFMAGVTAIPEIFDNDQSTVEATLWQ